MTDVLPPDRNRRQSGPTIGIDEINRLLSAHPGYRVDDLTHEEIWGPPENPWGESTPLQGETSALIWGGRLGFLKRVREGLRWRRKP